MTAAAQVTPTIRSALVDCWRDVSNAGGAVGFPFLPVDHDEVRRAVDFMVESLNPDLNRLLVATVDGELAGWLLLAGNHSKLTQHWAKVLRVQTALDHRGRGIGHALMDEVARAARDDFGLEQLHLELRGGLGLEEFYRRCGWHIIGRWPAALRLGPGDDRDEILMMRSLR